MSDVELGEWVDVLQDEVSSEAVVDTVARLPASVGHVFVETEPAACAKAVHAANHDTVALVEHREFLALQWHTAGSRSLIIPPRCAWSMGSLERVRLSTGPTVRAVVDGAPVRATTGPSDVTSLELEVEAGTVLTSTPSDPDVGSVSIYGPGGAKGRPADVIPLVPSHTGRLTLFVRTDRDRSVQVCAADAPVAAQVDQRIRPRADDCGRRLVPLQVRVREGEVLALRSSAGPLRGCAQRSQGSAHVSAVDACVTPSGSRGVIDFFAPVSSDDTDVELWVERVS